MNRRGTRKSVDDSYWPGRLDVARAYLKAAEDVLELADEGQNCSPSVSTIAIGAIAYADSLTARFAQVVNTGDHAQAPALLKEVLKDRLPQAQQSRFSRIIAKKDEAQYGARHITANDARDLLAHLLKFSVWAEDLHGPKVSQPARRSSPGL